MSPHPAPERPTMSTPYQPMNGAWYRVLTLAGEVQERMQYRDGQFYGTAKRGDGSVRVIPLADVERVARRFAPGFAGTSEAFKVVNEPTPRAALRPSKAPRTFVCADCGKEKTCGVRGCVPVRCNPCRKAAFPPARHVNGKSSETSGAAIIAALAQHGPMTTTELRHRLPHYRPHTLRTATQRMARVNMLTRTLVYGNGCSITQWAIGPVDYVERAALEAPPEEQDAPPEEQDAPWSPGVWTNPIAAGTARRVQSAQWVPMDYSDPRRRAA